MEHFSCHLKSVHNIHNLIEVRRIENAEKRKQDQLSTMTKMMVKLTIQNSYIGYWMIYPHQLNEKLQVQQIQIRI